MRRRMTTLALAAALVAAVLASPVAAGTGKCHSSGKKVIAVDPFAVFAHGTHATVVDAPGFDQSPTGKVVLTMWNLKTGKPFTMHELSEDLRLSFLDSPYGDPITLV